MKLVVDTFLKAHYGW